MQQVATVEPRRISSLYSEMVDQPYTNCHLCPRECGVNRVEGQCGVCGETAELRIASIAPHFGEEPSFTGTRGSGTIFFTGCGSRCFFCQNYQISHEGMGTVYTADTFYEAAMELVGKRVHNLNFVTPDHFWPHIAELCGRLRGEGVEIPFLFNCSGYEKPGMVPEYAEHIDIFMPDFKFADAALAKACMGDPRYPELAMETLGAMVDAKGFLHPWDPSGLETAREGVLVRHLVLPDNVQNSLDALRNLYDAFGPKLPLSVMSQFHPMAECTECHLLERHLLNEEFARVCELIEELGFEHVYVQSMPHSSDFLPDFRRPDPFRGNK